MRRWSGLRWSVTLILTAAVLMGCGARSAKPASPPPGGPDYSPAALRKLVQYDAGQSLNVRSEGPYDAAGTRLEKVWFDSSRAKNRNFTIYSSAKTSGRKPALVFHGMPRTSVLAQTGEAQMGWDGRCVCAYLGPSFPELTGDPTHDLKDLAAWVIEIRQILDILLKRSDVDPERLAYVGDGWGGVYASILAGAEPRLAALVISGIGDRVFDWVESDTKLPGSDDPAYRQELSRLDPARWVALPGNRSLLLQFGRDDDSVSADEADALFAAAAGAKERKDYGPEEYYSYYSQPRAMADRLAFLERVVELG